MGDGQLNGDPPQLRAAGSRGADPQALLEQPGFAALLSKVRQRLEAGGAPATITLRDMDPSCQSALADLLGAGRLSGPRQTVRVEDLDAALRDSRVGLGLVGLLEATGGPLHDRRRARQDHRADWDAVWASAARAADGLSQGQRWLADLRGDGLLVRYTEDAPAAAGDLLVQALTVIAGIQVPDEGSIARPVRGRPLQVLAASTVGDEHALDAGTELAHLVLRWAALQVGAAGVPTSSRGRRRLWSQVGVVCDEVSLSVLVLGLRPTGGGLLGDTMRGHAEAGEPLRVTLRQVTGADGLPASGRVFICENPTVVSAAADRLGPDCAPLVCVEGIPDTAAAELLDRLGAAGCALVFHADFDWGGIRIGNVLHRRHDATSWRFDIAAYRQACATTAGGRRLVAPAPTAGWDHSLAPAMLQHGRGISEEQLLDRMLDDLLRPG